VNTAEEELPDEVLALAVLLLAGAAAGALLAFVRRRAGRHS